MKRRNPDQFFEAVADEFEKSVKKPYREEPLTDEELDIFAEKLLLMIELEKKYGRNDN